MSKIRLGKACVRLMGLLALGVVLGFGLVPAGAARAQSPSDDRARFVSITRKLEDAPLQADARADREWALMWLTEAPDVSVTLCLSTLGGMEETYPYAGEITLQYAFEMAVLVIEHPDMASDRNAQQLAGASGALKTYRAILNSEPGAKSPALETLLETEARGGLAEFIAGNAANCS